VYACVHMSCTICSLSQCYEHGGIIIGIIVSKDSLTMFCGFEPRSLLTTLRSTDRRGNMCIDLLDFES
jgi:hypothetical protein